ncbi:ankyrin repeat domain-containing protein 50 [Microdochium nivale]|nr:ankyrin repeat domain-containing protein 50 [Microdochium nivale]
MADLGFVLTLFETIVDLQRLALNPQTSRTSTVVHHYTTTIIELEGLIMDFSDQIDMGTIREELRRLSDELSGVRNDLAELGGLFQRLSSLKKLMLIQASWRGLPMIKLPLLALQERVAGIWARQSHEARRDTADKALLAAQKKRLGPYEKAAVKALLDQYVDIAAQSVEAAQACLLSANRLIHGSQSAGGATAQHNATYDETEGSRRISVHKKLLDMLHYPSMGARQRNVSSPHEASCQWIYEDSEDTSGHSLPWWLDQDLGLYLISGKPGSGKSTLMRHIWETRFKKLCLEEWANKDDCSLLSASFFFWRNGTRLERSAEGLWRALLFKALDQAPELLPSVFPKEWALLYAGTPLLSLGAWSATELQHALQRLGTQGQKRIKLFFLIDGLDEHEEDGPDLSVCLEVLATKLALLPNIKIVLSSRPVESLEQLGLRPAASVQNHAHQDIASYVAEALTEVPRLWPHEGESITRDTVQQAIIHASQGVYLAAILLTRYVNRAYVGGKDLQDINDRILCGLDFKDLYRLVWETVDPHVQAEALKIMQVMLTREGIYRSLDGEERVPRLIDITLALAEAPTLERPWQTVQPLIERRCTAVARHFMEGWPGFITVCNWELDDAVSSGNHVVPRVSSASLVDYCHRSVPEFFLGLVTGHENERPAATFGPGLFRSDSQTSAFCPRIAQLNSLVYQITILPQPCPQEHLKTLWSFATMALMAANLVERHGRCDRRYLDLLQQLDRTMTFHHKRLQQASHGGYLPTTIRDYRATAAFSDGGLDALRLAEMHWANFHSEAPQAHPRNWNDSMASVAVHFGLEYYLKHTALDELRVQTFLSIFANPINLVYFSAAMIGAHYGDIAGLNLSNRRGRPLLMYALAPRLPFATIAPFDLVSVETVRILLDDRLWHNGKFGGVTCWREGLRWLHDTFFVNQGQAISAAGGTNSDIRMAAQNRVNICLLLLEKGADPTATIKVDVSPFQRTTPMASFEKDKKHTLTARAALEESFVNWVSKDTLDVLLAEVDRRVERWGRRRSLLRSPM